MKSDENNLEMSVSKNKVAYASQLLSLLIQVVVYCLLLAKLGDILHVATRTRLRYLFVWESSWWIDVVMALYVVCVIVAIVHIVRRNCHIGRGYWLFGGFLTLVWAYIRFFSDKIPTIGTDDVFCFTNLEWLPWLTWADVFVGGLWIMLVAYIVRRLIYRKTRTSEPEREVIMDNPIESEDEDKLDYARWAKIMCQEICDMKNDKAYSYGVVGEWGIGKTSYINLLKRELEETKKTIEIIDFNPRNSSRASRIQEDFLMTLCSSLKKYDLGLSLLTSRYVKALRLDSRIDIIASLLNIFPSGNVQSLRERICESIRRIERKVVVFIDDLDRLVVEEILEVLKLIDVNANFPNTIFVTAYDKTITNRMLREYLHLGDSSNFIDKFFEYEMIVPIRPYNKIFEYFKKEILKRCGYANEAPKVHEVTLDNLEQVISQYLTTMRDAKRFINLFVNDYEKVRDDVDFHDFLLLTILKYKSPKEHRRLYVEKKFLTRSTSRRIYLLNDDDEFKNTCNYKSIMRNLFFEYENNEPEGSYGRIFHIDAFETYFFTVMEGRLSQMEMVRLLSDDDFERVKKTIESWDKAVGSSDEQIKLIDTFIDYLSKRNIFKFNTRAEFERHVKVALLVYSKYSDGYNMLMPLFFESNTNDFVVAYGYELAQNYISFIKVCLQEQPDCYTITQKLLLNQIDNVFKEVPIIFSRGELFDITKGYFNRFMHDGSKLDKVHFNVLYSCIADIDAKTRKVTLDSECCKHTRLRIENEPEFYIKGFVRLGMMSSSPKFNSVACEPFWEQIFGDAGTLRQLIYDKKHNNLENIYRVRNFWKLYEKNDYMPIQVEGECDVQKEIDNDLMWMMKQLDDLQQREKEFTTLKDEYKNDVGLSNKSTLKFYKNKYEDLLSEVKKNKLHLTYAMNLHKDIMSEIDKLNVLLYTR